jgi:hypothetical protein
LAESIPSQSTSSLDAFSRVWVRMNTKGGSQESVDTPLTCWRTHPDKNVDIAVLKIGIGGYDHAAWPLERCVIGDKLDTVETGDRKVELGDEICFAGLFHSAKAIRLRCADGSRAASSKKMPSVT